MLAKISRLAATPSNYIRTMAMAHKKQKLDVKQEEVDPSSSTLPHFASRHYGAPSPKKKSLTSLMPQLEELIKLSSVAVDTTACVVHLFQRDFRITDNTSLLEATARASALKVPLVCLYIDFPNMDLAHSVSGWQREYRRQSLLKLQRRLEDEWHVPLHVVQSDAKRYTAALESILLPLLQKLRCNVVYTNILYEIDELRWCLQLLQLLPRLGVAFEARHDLCVMAPSSVKSQKGTPYAVFTPWYKTWSRQLDEGKAYMLEEGQFKPPNTSSDRTQLQHLFGSQIGNWLQIDPQQARKFDKYWEAGELEALAQVDRYITSDLIRQYAELRNGNIEPAKTSLLSCHLSSGTLSSRTVLRKLAQKFNIKSFVNASPAAGSGVALWIRQLAWRDFYTQVLCHWPYVCMFEPFQIDFGEIEWEYNASHFERWCQGQTGYPFVDALMRQLNETGYLLNRSRMVVASFLAKHLMIDWRYGERYFLENLVDGDFSNNNGGWGFSSSCGVDPQPYFRIFNPITQSQKFDSEGDFIRKWVPELRHVKGKQIHSPHDAKVPIKLDYPPPIVEHKLSRERALSRYQDAKNP
jgi:deoxyribodipyrimidine photo-lyase